MGLGSATEATFNGKSAMGTARLETDTLEFRSDAFKLSIPLRGIRKLLAVDGTLTITTAQGTVALELGPAAVKWAARIQDPPSRLAKIGAKRDWKASVIGQVERDFLDELEQAVALLSIGRLRKHSDAIFLGVTKPADLDRLRALKSSIQPAGAIWVIRPKGRPEVSEAAVRAAGRAVGLVDVKVVGFSLTHTAEKFVIPLADR